MHPGGLDEDQAREECRLFLKDSSRFEKGLVRVLSEWKYSCEHFLSNVSMNRIAWLGQAAMCIETGVPSVFRGGFKLLSKKDQGTADALAEKYLNRWLKNNEHAEENKQLCFDLEEA